MLDRDLSDPVTRSAAGTACIVQYRNECEARAEVDVWDHLDWSYDPRFRNEVINQRINRHAYGVIETILTRTHE